MVGATAEKELVIDPESGLRVLEPGYELKESEGVMSELNSTGDLRLVWDADKPDEVKAAKKQFEKMTGKKNYLAYKVKSKGENKGDKGNVMREFDPKAKMMILSPQMQGG
jgi:hypothetical protein